MVSWSLGIGLARHEVRVDTTISISVSQYPLYAQFNAEYWDTEVRISVFPYAMINQAGALRLDAENPTSLFPDDSRYPQTNNQWDLRHMSLKAPAR
jgi:hypothetical protein